MGLNIFLLVYIVYLKIIHLLWVEAIKECSELIKEARELDNDNTKQ
jgi:hypothetical protein